jgi:DNA adenine methylase Dam
MLVPFKWVGNKKTLLPIIQNAYNASGCTKIIEPFCGSAIFSLNTKADTIEISDSNNQLIDLWLDLKNHWEELNSILSKIDIIEISKVQEKYILLRKSYNKCSRGVLKSALLYVLLGGCTNNLARWNSAGEFNQTWGNRRAILEDYLVIELKDKIGATNFNIFCRPYGEINPDKNTFVYLDPPYLLSNDCYTANSWDLESEESLLDWIKTLKCKWALSNIITKNDKTNTLLQNFGKEYNLINLTKKYNAKVGGYKKGIKNNSQEILVTNFEFNQNKEFLDVVNSTPCDFNECKQNNNGACNPKSTPQDCPKNNEQSVYEDLSLLKHDGVCKKEEVVNKKIEAYYSE